ncbi:MAG: protein-glutamate O-methyltransferase CheR [Candidatus Riflebacteria bacterium]|nr:protein-glutamate O-methyltransferase CheR [Candidatus Riflebacteria bacterium]
MIENITAKDFEIFRNFVKESCGISLSYDRLFLIERKLEPIFKSFEFSDFSEFYEKLTSINGFFLREKLFDAITTNETCFFRDGHPFETFRNLVMPKIEFWLKNKSGGKKPGVRIWSAGSSTGQEPYSIAMIINQYASLMNSFSPDQIEIFASDISSGALGRAISGQYTSSQVKRGLSEQNLSIYFQQAGNKWIIDQKIRNMVEFKRVNFMENLSSLGKFDVIFFRNVLIYFDSATKTKILEKIYEMLSDDGYLFIGASEMIMGTDAGFKSERYDQTIFYKKVLPQTNLSSE